MTTLSCTVFSLMFRSMLGLFMKCELTVHLWQGVLVLMERSQVTFYNPVYVINGHMHTY